jgi:protein associated with RNAse G/E
MPGMNDITIYKCDHNGKVLWQYEGEVLSQETGTIVLEAFYNREDTPFEGIVIKTNDRFVETFYTDRWYNIFEIHDRDDGNIKGWYCNIGRPAVLKGNNKLLYDDLALDLWVTRDGNQRVLDKSEFEALGLDESTRTHALAGLAQLQEFFDHKFKD